MNKHLKLVKDLNNLNNTLASDGHFSDMDIVHHQALLMQQGSVVLKAIKVGDMVEILFGMIKLATTAVEAIAARGGDVMELPVTWRHDGSVISVMRTVSDKINQCSSGATEDYSAVYCLCVHLTRNFINADFDKAFQALNDFKKVANNINSLEQSKAPDLSDYLFE